MTDGAANAAARAGVRKPPKEEIAGRDMGGGAAGSMAGWRNSQAGAAREGASTITQQLARLMFLSPERSFRRKVQEALLALWLESQLKKEDILLRYLNTAYFGAGAYGVDAAAKRYFGKKAGELSLAESAMLAGLVRAPSQLAPTRNFGGAKERQEIVLQTMVETKALTPAEAEAEAARAQPVNLRTPPETPPGTNYFVDMVTADVRRLLGSSPGDLALRTTLNLELQRLAEGVIERRLEAEGPKKNVSQAALVALGRDGAVLAVKSHPSAPQRHPVLACRTHGRSLIKLPITVPQDHSENGTCCLNRSSIGGFFKRGFAPMERPVPEPVDPAAAMKCVACAAPPKPP